MSCKYFVLRKTNIVLDSYTNFGAIKPFNLLNFGYFLKIRICFWYTYCNQTL